MPTHPSMGRLLSQQFLISISLSLSVCIISLCESFVELVGGALGHQSGITAWFGAQEQSKRSKELERAGFKRGNSFSDCENYRQWSGADLREGIVPSMTGNGAGLIQ